MCFHDNVTLYRFVNVLACFIHVAFVVACCLTISKVDMVPYSRLVITRDQYVPTYPIYSVLLAHVFGVFTHSYFALNARHIVENNLSTTFTNPLRYVSQFLVDGFTFVGMGVLFSVCDIWSLVFILGTFGGIQALCYVHDSLPGHGAQRVAFLLQLMLVTFFVIKSTEMTQSKIASTVILVGAVQSTLMFVIQDLHIRNTRPLTVSEDDEKQDIDIEASTERLEYVLHQTLRGIWYDFAQVINSIVIHTTLTWVVIVMTREKITTIV